MMSDEDLIAYCDRHAETPRALFHASQIRRMFELAGQEPPREVVHNPNGFWSMHHDMKELVAQARARALVERR